MCVFASLRGHDLRSMLVQVMMTADPLISVAFYETTPPKNPNTTGACVGNEGIPVSRNHVHRSAIVINRALTVGCSRQIARQLAALVTRRISLSTCNGDEALRRSQ